MKLSSIEVYIEILEIMF